MLQLPQPIDDQVIGDLSTSEIFGHLSQELASDKQTLAEMDPPTSQKDFYVERLLNRSLEQLANDMDAVQDQLSENKAEINEFSDGLLSLIVMIGSDLAPRDKDDVEEKQKLFITISRE